MRTLRMEIRLMRKGDVIECRGFRITSKGNQEYIVEKNGVSQEVDCLQKVMGIIE